MLIDDIVPCDDGHCRIRLLFLLSLFANELKSPSRKKSSVHPPVRVLLAVS